MHHRPEGRHAVRWAVLVALVALCILVPADRAAAQTSVYLEAGLAPHGTWVEDPRYGRVWRPNQTPPDWRPYAYGRWVYTSAYGWVWVSDEPWGWVAYHYGYWVWSSHHGWVWIAGEVWGPAWVEWCYADGYIGWTPMPPDAYWQGAYYHGSFDCASPRTYSRAVFVAEASFTAPRISVHVVAGAQVAAIAHGAVNITKHTRAGDTVVNGGIDLRRLQAAVGQPIRPVRVVNATSPVATGAGSGPLRELRIFRPAISGLKAPKLDMDPSLKTDLEPRLKGPDSLAPVPMETGTLSASPAGRPLEAPALPFPGGRSIGGGGLGGGALGGGGIRLGR